MSKNLISIPNDMSAFFPVYREDAAPGVIMAANDANFDAAHLSEPLSEYSVGAIDEEGLLELLEAAVPSIPVGRSFSYRKHEDKEAFQAALNDSDIREIGGKFQEIRLTGTQADGRTDNKGLSIILDNDQGGEDPAVQQRAVVNLRGRLLRAELLRLQTALDANDTAASSSNWGASASGADPDAEVLAQVDLSGDARGIDPNVALYGGGAWVKRKRSYSGRDKAGAFAGLVASREQVADTIGVEKVLVSRFRYQSAVDTKGKMIGDLVWIYYARPGAMADDPSNVKRFVTNTPSGAFRVFIEPKLKRTRVTLEHYSRIVVTSTLGIRKLPVTFS
jgi:hypothetical protein